MNNKRGSGQHSNGAVGHFNVQSWVCAKRAAQLVAAFEQRGITINSGSLLIRTLMDFAHTILCNTPELQSAELDVSTAVNYLYRKGFSIKQIGGDPRSNKYMQWAVSQEDAIADSISQLQIAEKGRHIIRGTAPQTSQQQHDLREMKKQMILAEPDDSTSKYYDSNGALISKQQYIAENFPELAHIHADDAPTVHNTAAPTFDLSDISAADIARGNVGQ